MGDGLRVVEDFFRGFTEGNLDAVFDTMADDIEYTVNGRDTVTVEAIPWSRCFRGVDEVRRFFAQLMQHFQVEGFEVDQHIADGPDVASFGHFRYRALATDQSCETDWCARFHIEARKIARYQFFEDSYAVARAFRRGGSWEIENDGRIRSVPQ